LSHADNGNAAERIHVTPFCPRWISASAGEPRRLVRAVSVLDTASATQVATRSLPSEAEVSEWANSA
jgi:hypothetical protein